MSYYDNWDEETFRDFVKERDEVVQSTLEWNIKVARKLRDVFQKQEGKVAADWVKILTYNIDQTVMVLQMFLPTFAEQSEEAAVPMAPEEDYEQVEALENMLRL